MINWRELQKHPLNQFPAMQDWEFDELKESISKRYDDSMPITIFKGAADESYGIIDGANRHKACMETNTVPLIKEFYGTYAEAMEFIFRTNTRRNLTAAIKGKIVLDTEDMEIVLGEEAAKRQKELGADPLASRDAKGKTSAKLAEMAGVGQATIERLQAIKKHDPELYAALEENPSFSVKKAYEQVQDKINQGNESLRKQRLAKSILKNAIQDAINESKDELFAEALRRVESTEKNQIDFKLKLTLS